ncbi:MAG TPA: histidine kinase [Microlunatus sp.]
MMTASSGDLAGRPVAEIPAARPRQRRTLAAGFLSILVLIWISGAVIVATGPARPFTVIVRQPGLTGWVIGAGLALVGTGIALLLVSARRDTGLVLLLAGCCWFTPFWIAWGAAPPSAVALAHALSAALPALLIQAAMTFPGRRSTDRTRALLIVGWVTAGITFATRVALEDPFRDPACWTSCLMNPFAIEAAAPLARLVTSVLAWISATAIAAAAAGLARSAWQASAYRLELGVAGVGMALIAACAIGLAVVAPGTSGDPARVEVSTLWIAGCAGVGLLSIAQLAAAADSWTRRRRVSDLMLSATTPAGDLQDALRRAFDDPRLILAYWLPESRRLMTGAGEIDPATVLDLVSSDVRFGDRRIATILHTASATELMSSIGPTLRLRMENELLSTESALQLHALRESSVRIVAAADARRRLLERNLHDGAQQHLLALGTRLQVASRAARDGGDAHGARVLDSLVDETRAALEDLRTLARGIFPAELANDGLAAALTNLSIDAPLPVDVEVEDAARSPAEAEAAIYLCARALIDSAWQRGATQVRILAVSDASSVRLTCRHEMEQLDLPQHLRDRVAALGGTVVSRRQVTQVGVGCP